MRILFCLTLLACTTNNNGPADDTASCADLAAHWTTSGTCGGDSCDIAQTGCSITQVTCTSGARSTSGEIDGDHFTYRGIGATGAPATCSGTSSGNMISGTCTVNGGGTCSFSGQRR